MDREARMGTPGRLPGPASSSTPRGLSTYRKLRGSEVRLLKVRPGSLRERVSCTMHYVPLDERTKYVALSYTWGNPDDTDEILLNGNSHCITASLLAALRHFRWLCSQGLGLDGFTFREGMYLWADALCINQDDEREKESEIPRMGDIYTLSSRVFAWLGETKGSVEGFALQEFLRSEQYDEYGEDIHVEILKTSFEQRTLLRQRIEYVVGDIFKDVFRLLYDLASRDWFLRVWIIQEAALPAADPILMAGPFLFGFERFTRLCEVVAAIWGRDTQATSAQSLMAGELVHQAALLRGRIQFQDSPAKTRDILEDRQLRFGQAFEDAVLRWGYGKFEATKPHDYIYGMIGLCGGNAMIPPALRPNYQRPFPKVCEDYARYIISSTGSVAILARSDCDTFNDNDIGVPSWVPDFSAWLAPQEPPSVRGDPDPSAVSFVGPYRKLLKVRGFSLGKVTGVYFPLGWEDGDEDEDEYNDDDEYDDDDCSDLIRHHDQFLRQVAHERKIRYRDAVADWLANNIQHKPAWSKEPTIEVLLQIYAYFYHLRRNDNNPLRSQSEYVRNVLKTFMRHARYGITHQITFLCQGGVHAGPYRKVFPPPRRGDHLVALRGSGQPFLLRPVPTAEGEGYVLLSPCVGYHGTSMLDYKLDDFSLQHHAERQFESFIIA